MKKHLEAMSPMEDLGMKLSAKNVCLLTSFLAAAKFSVSDVATNFQVLNHRDHRVWIVPLKNMWKPPFGCPEFLAQRGWRSHLFAHGSDESGILHVLQCRKMRRCSASDEEDRKVGFFLCEATSDVGEGMWAILRCWSSKQNQAGVVIVGTAVNREIRQARKSGQTRDERQECLRADVVCDLQNRRWCVNPEVACVAGLAVVQSKVEGA